MYDAGDEEMGESRMREVDPMTPVQANYPSSVKEATLVPLPPSNAVSPSTSLVPTTIDTLSEPPNIQITDNFDSPSLLTDAAPPDPTPDATRVADASLSSIATARAPTDSSDSSSGPQAAKEEEPQHSVRLVGRGGISDEALVDDATGIPDASGLSKKSSGDHSTLSGSSSRRKSEAV